MSVHLHCRYLRRYVKRGDQILEAGGGAGRFTIELARLGADISVGDVSPGQSELNRKKVAEAGSKQRIVTREHLDVTALSRFPDRNFDGVVCWETRQLRLRRTDDAIAGMLRVTKPGGHVLLSVMSLVGATRRFLPSILEPVSEPQV